jgi:hypothetical protein
MVTDAGLVTRLVTINARVHITLQHQPASSHENDTLQHRIVARVKTQPAFHVLMPSKELA